ncbi:hypothetical protein H2202_005391 [Exophiala xenobiotica]|nr:hypothetical protein H2202_005391 [Exophiala xenobiotica]KAK5230786.1 hypothetical protein LTR47_007341 [Exophiala xenobiotica]KAK5246997.1 hypothetical protein LTS06_007781 [Exophiala xenobiotica]KAK5258007.1 hypothetical protein LTR40_008761 [Exophiala xenobiotica]KAK5320710.1 hypothetical protein LTR93_006922 [Exophiala xenobiotica]
MGCCGSKSAGHQETRRPSTSNYYINDGGPQPRRLTPNMAERKAERKAIALHRIAVPEDDPFRELLEREAVPQPPFGPPRRIAKPSMAERNAAARHKIALARHAAHRL